MMQAVGSARLVYLVWVVGGLLSMFGAMTYAELGAMKPQAGGEYIYIRDAYGPLPAFLYALDMVRHRQARLGRDHNHRARPHSRHLQRAVIPQSGCGRFSRSPSPTASLSLCSPPRSSPA